MSGPPRSRRHADAAGERMSATPASRSPRLNLPAIALGIAVVALLNLWLGGWITPAEGEYRPGYLVILVALLVPGFLGALVSGLAARHRFPTHGLMAGLGMFLVELIWGAVGGELAIGTVIVRALGFAAGAALGGHAAGRVADYLRSARAQAADRVAGPSDSAPLLEVDGLSMHYRTSIGWVSAVDGVSFVLHKGEALGLVGESGCGKTSVAMSLLRLLPENAEFRGGSIRLNGTDLLEMTEDQMRSRRWSDIAMVFQGAMNAWNPVYTVYEQIREAMVTHFGGELKEDQIRDRVGELFDLVGLNRAMVDRYPHEFSGGMRQRAVIAMALSCDPQVIIADEPTTALDVIVQDQILQELKQVQTALGMSIIYISHDIAVIAEVTEVMGVMYAGRLVELGPTEDVFSRPRHPYTYLLLQSTPSVTGPRRVLAPLEGEPPNLVDPPTGCRFHPRCPYADQRCREENPTMEVIDPQSGYAVACWNWTSVPVRIRKGVEA